MKHLFKYFCKTIGVLGVLQKRNQRWHAAGRAYGAVLPQAVVDDLVNREISDNDYDLLMQLDK